MIAKEAITEALLARHACKLFDETQKIPADDLTFILESGRLSPSSFGMEPWRFIVVQDPKLKQAIRPSCWDQPQITTCSDLIIIMAKLADVRPGAAYTRSIFARRNLSPEMTQAYHTKYDTWIGRYNDDQFEGWSKRQCYIDAATMMNTAAMIGIDSCAIEGFEADPIHTLLGIDTTQETIAMLLPLGYRVNPITPKKRHPLEMIVDYR